MRGKLARALRRVVGFNPSDKRDYRITNKGTIVETTLDENGVDTMVTVRSIYRMSKKKYILGKGALNESLKWRNNYGSSSRYTQ